MAVETTDLAAMTTYLRALPQADTVAQAAPRPAAPVMATRGEALYGQHCASCHGKQGEGAGNADALPLTGIVLTKLDGDSRGGAALSVRQITGAPIKFAGVSEKIDGLEVFDAERHAGRVLGMGDIVALVEEVARLMRSEFHVIDRDAVDGAAQLIMAQLAHVQHLAPERFRAASPATPPEEGAK